MIILAVESSCDETAVALVRDGRTVLADCIASSVEMHPDLWRGGAGDCLPEAH